MTTDTGTRKSKGGRPRRLLSNDPSMEYVPEEIRNDRRRLLEWGTAVEAVASLYRIDDPAARWALEPRRNEADFKRRTLLVEIGQWPEHLRLEVAQEAYRHRGTPVRDLVRAFRRARRETRTSEV